jgi:ATP-dependent RNA helicase RhlE
MDFTEFDFHPDLLDGIDSLNFKKATPIQEQAIPLILEGKDLIGIAQTGTGKTAAFILPILDMILDMPEDHFTKALVVVPTRELAMQIDQAVEAYSYFTGISCIAVYGGSGGSEFSQERQALSKGAELIIATPGRLIAHLNMGYVNFSKLRFLVLDEADRMLDMGFMPDLNKIINTLNPDRQNLLFSATMPQGVMKLAKTLMRDPVSVNIALSKPRRRCTPGRLCRTRRTETAALAGNPQRPHGPAHPRVQQHQTGCDQTVPETQAQKPDRRHDQQRPGANRPRKGHACVPKPPD